MTELTVPGANTSLDEWLSYIESIHAKPIDMGLDRVRTVALKMGWNLSSHLLDKAGEGFDDKAVFSPNEPVVITVGGTNGKGSTCAMLESILLQSGYKVGMYTSPHLLNFTERARVNGEIVADAEMVSALQKVEVERGQISLSYFEFTTLAILHLFFTKQLDVLVLEVGLGGRLDAVNIINADCAVVTSVDIDHVEHLGPTREHIGREKAGIFRAGRPAIVSDPQPPASLIEVAAGLQCDVWLFGRDFNYQGDRQQWGYAGREVRRGAIAYPALRGANQLLNASAVLAALESLRGRVAIPAQSVRQGFALVDWPGRFQVLPGLPAIVLDVAHNPHAAAHLRSNLDGMGFHPFTHAVFGMLADKDVDAVIHHLKDKVDHWHLVSTTGARGLSASELLEKLRSQGVQGEAFDWAANAKSRRDGGIARQAPEKTVQIYEQIAQAFNVAKEGADQNDRIVVFGSFLTVAAVMKARQKVK